MDSSSSTDEKLELCFNGEVYPYVQELKKGGGPELSEGGNKVDLIGNKPVIQVSNLSLNLEDFKFGDLLSDWSPPS